MYGHRVRRAAALAAVLVLASIPLLPPEAGAEAWTKNDMGQAYAGNAYYGLRGVAVGDGDRDDRNEVYVTSYDDSTVYQYTFTEAGWVSNAIFTGGTYIYRVLVGDGDDDGKTEVYATGYRYASGRYGPMLAQVYYDSDQWNTEFITTLGYYTYSAAIGDGNNDNRTEIYTADYYGHVYQNSKGTSWDSQDIGNTTPAENSTYAVLYGICVGDGDNDGRNEIYSSSRIGYVDRYSFDEGAWRRTVVGRGEHNQLYGENYSSISAVEVGDVDNDGRNEIYGVSWTNASVYRFSWNSSSKKWDMTTIATLGNRVYAYSVAIGDADGDGRNELYAGTYKQVYKVWYDDKNGEWRSVGVGGGNHYMYDLAIGSATGDAGQVELYGACLDGHAYQFYTDKAPPANPIVSSDTHPVPGNWYNRSVVHVMWKDPGYDISGIDGYSVAWDKSPTTVPDATKDFEEKVHEMNSTPLSDGKSWYFHIRSRDNAVNWNLSAAHFGPICIDTRPPDSLSLRINDGEAYASGRKVSLFLEATDPTPGAGVALMSFSNDGVLWSPYERFAAERHEWDITQPRYGGNDSDGLKYVHARVMDGAGNEMAQGKWARAGVFLDRGDPFGLSVLIDGGDEFTTDPDVELGLSASDAASGVASMAFSNDGVAWSDWQEFGSTAAWSLTQGAGGSGSDGNRSVFFRVRDGAGNAAGPVKDHIILDRAPPEGLSVTIDNGAEYTTCATVQLALSCSDPYPGSGLTEMALSNDAGTAGPWEPFSSRVDGWSLVSGTGGKDADGLRTVHLRSRDRAGNLAGPASSSIFLDRVAPDPVSVVLSGGAPYTNKRQVQLALAADDPSPGSGVYGMQLSEDGVRWTDWEAFCTSLPHTLGGPDGTKTVHLRVRDRAGNLGPVAQDSIVLDTLPPVITNVRVMGVTDSSAIVGWSTNEDADSAVHYGTTAAYGSRVFDPSPATDHALTLRGLSAKTTYHFQVSSADLAGNPPSRSPDLVFTTAAVPDTGPPMLSGIRVDGITDVLAVVSWSTSEPADGKVRFGKTSTLGQSVSEPALSLDHSLVIAGLSPSTTYHFRVESTDSSGNGPATGPDMTFTTLSAPDTAPPVVMNVRVSGITDRLAIVTFETDEPGDTLVEYGNTTAYGSVLSGGAFVTIHEVTLSGLAPVSTYHFRVGSKDATGNGPSFSGDLSFMTADRPDTAAPVISRLRVEGVSDRTATVLWETDEPADSLVELGVTVNLGTTAADPSFRLQHSVTVSGLKANTLYHMKVRSTDPGGNAAASGGHSFRTAKSGTGGPDTTPPVISDVKVSGVTDSLALVTWRTDELSSGEVEYGTTMAYGLRASDPSHLREHGVLLVGLRPSTEYHLRVKAEDILGNGPSASADLSFTTSSGPDRTGPVISDVRVLNITKGSATITWRTDEPADSLVEYGPDDLYGTRRASRIFTTEHVITLAGLSPGVTYHFRVGSTDPTGNPSEAGRDLTFTTTGGGPQPGPQPGGGLPAVTVDNPWPWVALAAGLVAAGAGAIWYRRRRSRDQAAPKTAPEGAASPVGPAGPVEPLETLEMEAASTGAAAAVLARSRQPGPKPQPSPESHAPLRHIRCPSCKTRIPLYKEGPQQIQCPGCGKKGPYKPKV